MSTWRDVVRDELEQYRDETGRDVVSLEELKEFSLDRLKAEFPQNNHLEEGLRRTLQELRDRSEIEFVDNQGQYRIIERYAIPKLQLNHPKNYLGYVVAIGKADSVPEANKLATTYLVDAPDGMQSGARHFGLIETESEVKITDTGQKILRFARREYEDLELALKALDEISAYSRFAEVAPAWAQILCEVLLEVDSLRYLFNLIDEIQREADEDGHLTQIAFQNFVEELAKRDLEFTLDLFFRAEKQEEAADLLRKLRENPDPSEQASLREDLEDPTLYYNPTTFQLKMMLWHAGIVTTRGKETKHLTEYPARFAWGLQPEFRSVLEDERQYAGLYLVPVSSEWQERFHQTVEKPLEISEADKVPKPLVGHNNLRVWGTTETDSAKKQAAVDAMREGDWVLFYHDKEFVCGGRIGRAFENPEVGKWLWNQPESIYIYTIEDFRETTPSINEVWELLGYDGRRVVQGFTRVDDDRVEELVDKYGSVEAAIFGTSALGSITKREVEQERESLKDRTKTQPQLTESDPEFTDHQRRVRDTAFSTAVKEAYDETCAVCGSRRESPAGNPEVEAAHIYPKSENGSDDPRNGIALCKLHHWAFDVEWIGITVEGIVKVRDAPGSAGYEEFQRLEGKELYLPNDPSKRPDPIFIEARQQMSEIFEE